MKHTGRPSGTATQAERVLRLARDLAVPTAIDTLARRHDVTPRTIRRDLDVLDAVLGVDRSTDDDGVACFVLRRPFPAKE